jgi:hypothetical protein
VLPPRFRPLVSLAACFAVSACARIHETHYFQQNLADSSGRANYFRLEVSGRAYFSAARYIAGFYDERAVDLFFNEVKSGGTSDKKTGDNTEAPASSSAATSTIRPLFAADATLPGTDEVVKPLKDPGDGTFLMLFSTNATAVADAIGQFAENQLAADALTNIVNRSEIRSRAERQGRAEGRLAGVSALKATLDALVELVPKGADPSVPATERSMLRILNALARGLGHSGSFASITEASAWFAATQR